MFQQPLSFALQKLGFPIVCFQYVLSFVRNARFAFSGDIKSPRKLGVSACLSCVTAWTLRRGSAAFSNLPKPPVSRRQAGQIGSTSYPVIIAYIPLVVKRNYCPIRRRPRPLAIFDEALPPRGSENTCAEGTLAPTGRTTLAQGHRRCEKIVELAQRRRDAEIRNK